MVYVGWVAASYNISVHSFHFVGESPFGQYYLVERYFLRFRDLGVLSWRVYLLYFSMYFNHIN